MEGDARRLKRKRRLSPSVARCDICGDDTRNRHFGGQACDSCRAFFRRTVQKNSNVTVDNRNNCKKCRYNKCLQCGMNPKYVLNEADCRVRTEKRTSGQQQQQQRRQEQHRSPRRRLSSSSLDTIERIYSPDIQQFRDNLSQEEYSSVVGLVMIFSDVASKLRHGCVTKVIHKSFPNLEFVNEFAVCLATRSRANRFAFSLSDFQRLRPCDRDVLLLKNGYRIVDLRKSFGFDPVDLTWPSDRVVESRIGEQVQMNLDTWIMPDEVRRLRTNLIRKMDKLQLDEPSLLLLMLIMLFSPETPGLIDVDEVSAIQERFLSILRKYVQWRYGVLSVSVVFPKLLSLLTDLQEIQDVSSSTASDFPPDDDPEIISLCSKLGNCFDDPVSPMESPPNGHLSSESGYGTDPQEDSQNSDDIDSDLFDLLESVSDMGYDHQDLENVINTEDLLHPHFVNLPGPYY